MTDEDVATAFKLYQDYTDVIEKSKVVTIEEIRAKDYTLSVNSYIEKKAQKAVDPAEVRQQFFAALAEAQEAEKRFKQLLVEGGYIDE